MSVEHLAAVLHHSRAKGTHKLVLLGIANHQGDGGAWPSVYTLANYANVTERNVQKSLSWLVDHNELRIDRQAGGLPNMADHARPNRYEVLVTCPPWCDRSPQHRDTRRLGGPRNRQLALWKDPVSDATPPVGIDTPPVSDATSPPVSDATPEPSLEPSINAPRTSPAQVLDTRACVTCHHPQARCEAAQSHLNLEDTHAYQPRMVAHATG